MSISTQLQRLLSVRTAIRNVLISWGVITDSAADIEDCQAALEKIKNNGNISVALDAENASKELSAGYYSGGKVNIEIQEKTATANGDITPDSGKVLSKVTVDVTPKVQTKTVIPTKSVQNVSPDDGYEALSEVEVGAIPDAYQNVSGVTASAADVLANKIIVTADGTVTPGTMLNNGAVDLSIDGLNETEITVPEGYHNGEGKVSLTDAIEQALAAI